MYTVKNYYIHIMYFLCANIKNDMFIVLRRENHSALFQV